MDKDFRKRLEEAAEEEYPIAYIYNALAMEYEDVNSEARNSFITGAEYGYKEAIAMAKEWIQKNVPIILTEEGDYVRVNMGHKNVSMNKYLADFETDMNKLWEGTK